MGEAFDAYFQRKVVALAGDINKDYMVLLRAKVKRAEIDTAIVSAVIRLLLTGVTYKLTLSASARVRCV